jgi:hypothetical protein
MAPEPHKQVPDLVSHYVAENHCAPHTAMFRKLFSIVCENVGGRAEASIVWGECESEALLNLLQRILHGLREDADRQFLWTDRNLASRKLSGLLWR